jgi:myo-inositol 2-dehydrogenase / D-chiro-inositol 1-dehydrogenase
MTKKLKLDRRDFIAKTALGTIGAAAFLNSCTRKREEGPPRLLDQAPDGRVLRAGLVGCGGRGTGAAIDFLDAGPNLQIVALGDVFQDKIDACRESLRSERNVEVADENCFVGFDSYQRVIDSGIDVVLLCTPPKFRPEHIEAAVVARKHIFMEKPIAVDPVGARSVLGSVQKAKAIDLNMVSGTVYRVAKDYMETNRRIAGGEIGEITGGSIIRNGGALWFRRRQPAWTDMEYMLRNWVNFCWLSGDHITEMFIHQLDLMNWNMGKLPVMASGYGGRHRRVTGDQYDFFSIDYIYDNGIHAHAAVRQINGTSNRTLTQVFGTKGYADVSGKIYDLNGNATWEYPYPGDNDTNSEWKVTNPFVQEHINLVTGIRTGETVNDGENQVNSTLVSIMGRMAAYTGRDVKWEEVMNSDLYLGPKTYSFGPVPEVSEEIPVPGIPNT